MAFEIGRRPAPSFALIIGIDDYAYAHYQNLRGAVADAKAMKQYLEEVLQVSSDRIHTLYNEEATRDTIVKALQELPKNKKIQKGDPIMIFYAGHGSELTAPTAWRVKTKIQCLIPQDCELEAADTKPVPGREPILDRTIGVLLEDIAKEKGDNITVIMDCCHSASGTRYDIPRNVELATLEIPELLDGHIWSGRFGKIANGFAYHGLRSHVLLAACGEKESAYENDNRGQFTRELLKTLENCAVNNLDLSYSEVLERIHLPHQHPQCEGLNRNRVFFDTRVPAGRQVWYPLQIVDGKYVIQAGLSHGIAPGVEFALYNSERLWLGVILVDETCSINDFETTITTLVVLENALFAKVTRVGRVPIYIGNQSVLEESLRRMNKITSNAQKFRVVGEVKEAKLHVVMENERVVFKILDQRVRELGLGELPYKTTAESIGHVLPAAAHFFWYLDLENKKTRLGTNNDISVNFYLLKKDYDDFGMRFMYPMEPGFCRKDPNSGNSDVIDFVVNPEGRYGIEIKNSTKKDLYLNAFLFNYSSLSVALCHTQSSAGEPEAPLKQGGSFTIGYGTAGSPPFSYSLEDGQDVDVGYLKIYFATRPIDLSDIEQPSPFLSVHPPPTHSRRESVLFKKVPHARDVWFTVMVPVVQRRA